MLDEIHYKWRFESVLSDCCEHSTNTHIDAAFISFGVTAGKHHTPYVSHLFSSSGENQWLLQLYSSDSLVALV